jgi:plastocyanin
MMRKRTIAVAVSVSVLVATVAALPVFAATPRFTGTVGPAFTITMAKKPTKPGKITLVVSDRSTIHNFRLRGPGVNVATSVAATGTRTFRNVTLKKGRYTFVCDPHATSMRGSFTIR